MLLAELAALTLFYHASTPGPLVGLWAQLLDLAVVGLVKTVSAGLCAWALLPRAEREPSPKELARLRRLRSWREGAQAGADSPDVSSIVMRQLGLGRAGCWAGTVWHLERF